MNSKKNWEGAEYAASNANDLLAISKAAFRKRKYGISLSLAVLSAEESSKSYGLALHAIEPNAELRPIKQFFRSHKEKQEMGAALLIGARFGVFLREISEEIAKDKSLSEHEIGERVLERIQAEAELAKVQGTPKFISEVDAWKNEADKLKQDGLYVTVEEGRWHTPSMIGRGRAKHFVELAENMLQVASTICLPELREQVSSVIKSNMK